MSPVIVAACIASATTLVATWMDLNKKKDQPPPRPGHTVIFAEDHSTEHIEHRKNSGLVLLVALTFVLTFVVVLVLFEAPSNHDDAASATSSGTIVRSASTTSSLVAETSRSTFQPPEVQKSVLAACPRPAALQHAADVSGNRLIIKDMPADDAIAVLRAVVRGKNEGEMTVSICRAGNDATLWYVAVNHSLRGLVVRAQREGSSFRAEQRWGDGFSEYFLTQTDYLADQETGLRVVEHRGGSRPQIRESRLPLVCVDADEHEGFELASTQTPCSPTQLTLPPPLQDWY